MTDLFGFDLADGFASGQCPICFALGRDERRWVDSFRREGKQDADARSRFYAGGGFCRRHAWLLHELAVEHGSGAPIADVYGNLADRDLAAIDTLLAGGRHLALARAASCSACVAEADALERKQHFFLELVETSAGRDRYARSAPLCFPHLASALAAAGDGDTGRFLLGDWHRRLAEARERLAEFDRKRDHRFAGQRHDAEARSWTDIIRLYVGEPPRRAEEATPGSTI